MHVPPHLEISAIPGKGKSLRAKKAFQPNEVVLPVEYEEIRPFSKASPWAMQIDDNKFVDTKEFVVGDYINHSCDPTLKIDFNRLTFVANKPIVPGDELTYNYDTTEFDLVRDRLDFTCHCGSKNCIGKIKGFKFLPQARKEQLLPLLPKFLRKKI